MSNLTFSFAVEWIPDQIKSLVIDDRRAKVLLFFLKQGHVILYIKMTTWSQHCKCLLLNLLHCNPFLFVCLAAHFLKFKWMVPNYWKKFEYFFARSIWEFKWDNCTYFSFISQTVNLHWCQWEFWVWKNTGFDSQVSRIGSEYTVFWSTKSEIHAIHFSGHSSWRNTFCLLVTIR